MKKLLNTPIFLLLAFFWGCSKGNEQTEVLIPEVTVVRAEAKTTSLTLDVSGHLEAYRIVTVMAQVDGQLLHIHFKEGDKVRKGDLLFEIDPRTYEADVIKAEGDLAKNQAQLFYAERTAERNAKLVKDEYISQDTYDNLLTNVLMQEALVKQSRAELEQAKINLGYTKIYSPIDGYVGEYLLDAGNLILESGETPLATLNQISPIYATGFISERDLPKLIQRRAYKSLLKTLVQVEGEELSTYEGELTFVDNAVDLSTGMIKVKALLPNNDRSLWPNQYIKMKIVLETIDHSVVVPVQAIQEGAKGPFVYVVKGNKQVEMRSVITGQVEEKGKVVITSGLREKERIVTEGQMKLVPGMRVTVTGDEGA